MEDVKSGNNKHESMTHRSCKRISCELVVVVLSLVIQCHGLSETATHSAQFKSRLKKAIQLTKASNTNIAQAYEACAEWKDLVPQIRQESMRAVCNGLYASSLTRVGRDEEALGVFDACLAMERYMTSASLRDVIMAKGKALQRLMRYKEAKEVFLHCDTVESAIIAAATCSMRVGDVRWAELVLQSFCESNPECNQAAAMLGTLSFLESIHRSNGISNEVLDLLSSSVDPLYEWIRGIVSLKQEAVNPKSVSVFMDSTSPLFHLELAKVNQSPFDDPCLIQLDDKVFLHELLREYNNGQANQFWPRGFVLPEQMAQFQQVSATTSKNWIIKQRTGYGSHGNQLVDAATPVQVERSRQSLCQELVGPPLLIDCRKFSIRVYVVYFMDAMESFTGNVFISSEGLVKLASVPFVKGVRDDARMHMTNSGREDTMMQQDFLFLKKEFEKRNWSFEDFWNRVRTSVRATMEAFLCQSNDELKSHRLALAQLGIPKIMGLDYMLDNNQTPWLLEVNRFPGLEARASDDARVKREVVADAWHCASQRMGIDLHFADYAQAALTSLEQI